MSMKVRFGVYELDRAAMELRKHGVRIRLQEQPFRVLATLVDKPGEIVTRDELKTQIWANDTFVDFDQSLNKAVNRLREALNDDTSQPRYIETVPRRGYRFVAPVTACISDDAPPLAPQRDVESVRQQERAQIPLRKNRRHTIFVASGVGVVVASCIAVSWWLREPRNSGPQTPIRITRDGLAQSPKMSRDGKLLCYTSRAGGEKMHIWVRQIAGGESMQVTKGLEDETQPDISPDGTQIAFRSEQDGGGIYIVPTLGGEPRLLVSGGSSPSFSPNGNEVLFLLGENGGVPEAHVIPLQGGASRQLCPNWTIGRGFWEPDGQAILFFGERRDQLGRFGRWMLISATGGEPRRFSLPGDDHYGSTFPNVMNWTRSRDNREWIVFGSGSGDTYNLFRVPASGGKLAGRQEQLTSGAAVNDEGNLSEDGKLVFTSGTYGGQIWIVMADTGQAQAKGQPEQVTHTDGVVNHSPSMSRDGRWLAYAETNPVSGHGTLRLKDFSTGVERQLFEGLGLGETSISPDGSKVAYWGIMNDRRVTFVIPVGKRTPLKVCEDCWARGFSSNGSVLLTQQGALKNKRARIVAVQIPSGKEEDFLDDPTSGLWHAFFSWDDRWVCFKRVREEPWAALMITPVRNGVPAPQAEWISVTDGRFADDKPQFSPDGNTLYFTSTRDKHLCIWAQHLDRITKHPVGAPFAVQHFHDAQSWRIMDNLHSVQLWVARDKIVTNFPEFHGDIWMTKLN